VTALYTSKHAIAPIQAHAGMGTTKKRRNRAFGAAKAKKDARAYIAPASRSESVREYSTRFGEGREEMMRTACTMRMIIASLIPCQR